LREAEYMAGPNRSIHFRHHSASAGLWGREYKSAL
jgi:hypothetical protein